MRRGVYPKRKKQIVSASTVAVQQLRELFCNAPTRQHNVAIVMGDNAGRFISAIREHTPHVSVHVYTGNHQASRALDVQYAHLYASRGLVVARDPLRMPWAKTCAVIFTSPELVSKYLGMCIPRLANGTHVGCVGYTYSIDCPVQRAVHHVVRSGKILWNTYMPAYGMCVLQTAADPLITNRSNVQFVAVVNSKKDADACFEALWHPSLRITRVVPDDVTSLFSTYNGVILQDTAVAQQVAQNLRVCVITQKSKAWNRRSQTLTLEDGAGAWEDRQRLQQFLRVRALH